MHNGIVTKAVNTDKQPNIMNMSVRQIFCNKILKQLSPEILSFN